MLCIQNPIRPPDLIKENVIQIMAALTYAEVIERVD